MQPRYLTADSSSTAVNVLRLAAVPYIGSFTVSHAGVAVRVILPPTRMLQFLRGCERKVDRHQCVVTAEPLGSFRLEAYQLFYQLHWQVMLNVLDLLKV